MNALDKITHWVNTPLESDEGPSVADVLVEMNVQREIQNTLENQLVLYREKSITSILMSEDPWIGYLEDSIEAQIRIVELLGRYSKLLLDQHVKSIINGTF